MNFLNKILEKRQLEKCPLPLWKLKVTDEEYEELRSLLEKRTHIISSNDIFLNYHRECALFFAEFWRREYKDGIHSKALVYNALRSSIHSRNFSTDFYEAATKGAKSLGIEIYEGERVETFDSILYQGGLPMNLLTSSSQYGTWERFTRGLINRHINFEELNLGLIATESNSIQQYCDQLVNAIEAEQYLLMPFFCKNENDSWYVYLQNLAKQERHRKRQLCPFTLDWDFTLDLNAKRLIVNYRFKGSQNLPKAFIEDQQLSSHNFFTTQVRVNGKVTDSYDYINFYSRYAVGCRHLYNDGDNIAFYINDAEEPHLVGELDMSVPHLVYANEKGHYLLGNRLGKVDSAIIYPSSWLLENKNIENEAYNWKDASFNVAIIPEGYQDTITLTGEDGNIAFSSTAKLIWTDIKGCSVSEDNVSELLYDAESLRYFICYDGEDDVRNVLTNNVEFRSMRQAEWQRNAPYGRILVRAKDSNGRFVTPYKMTNVGAKEDLVIYNVSDTEDTCTMKVTWKHGKVVCENGAKRINDQWEVKKENCKNNKIQFTLIPDGDSQSQFTITVRAPFKEFAILDIEDRPVKSNSWVPYVDIDKYQYHLVGQSIKRYTYGNKIREIKEICNKLYIIEDGKTLKSIPFEGSLTALFDTREVLRAMLDQTSDNMLDAAVEISFLTSKGETLTFEVKDSPYRVQSVENRIFINSKDRQIIDYRGTLKLLKLNEPEHEPRELFYDENNGYIVPEDIYDWGKVIVVGRSRGRICPGLIDMTQLLNGETRKNMREDTIRSIHDEINASTLGNAFWTRALGWYKRVKKEDIPASSLLELMCIADNPTALLCMTFQLYAQCIDDESKENLANELKILSNDLSFQWYWIREQIKSAMKCLNTKVESIDNSVIRSIYASWAMKQDNPMKYLQNIDEYFMSCIIENVQNYQEWMFKLATESIQEKYEDKKYPFVETIAVDIARDNKLCYVEDGEQIYVTTKQDRSWKVSPFFDKYAENMLGTENERWLMKRVNAMADHMEGKINLFSERGVVRRSIIFCSKSCNTKFVIELNNKLTRR